MTWEETAVGMMSTDYRERFVAEYWQLRIRIERLSDVIDGYNRFAFVCPKSLFESQLMAMKSYKIMLEQRAKLDKIDLG